MTAALFQLPGCRYKTSSYKAPNAPNVYFLTHKVTDLHSIKVEKIKKKCIGSKERHQVTFRNEPSEGFKLFIQLVYFLIYALFLIGR